MREFKFRAYVKEIEEIFKVGKIDFENKLVRLKKDYGNKEYSFEEIELMQYTGLKDKNGVEICEGNIVRVNDWRDYTYHEIKCFVDRDYPAFDLYPNINPNINCDCNGLSFVMQALQIEIIGNIYENPELLEVK